MKTIKTNKVYTRKTALKNDCAMESTLNLLSGKWKLSILSGLFAMGSVRPSQLLKESPDATRKVLLQQLKELEAAGIISRTTYAEVPPRVEYALTEKGRSLKPVLDALREWGEQYNMEIGSSPD